MPHLSPLLDFVLFLPFSLSTYKSGLATQLQIARLFRHSVVGCTEKNPPPPGPN